MSDVPVSWYYNQYTAKERSYVDYMGEVNKSLSSNMERNANRQIAANAMFAGEIKSTLISNQIATEKALYNHTQQINGTLMDGFSDVSNQLQSGLSGVSRQLGVMGATMNMGFALINSSVQESSKAICEKLDNINETLKNPLQTEARELYNMALRNYNKRLYEEALENLQEAIKKYKTEPLSYFLMGQTYLRGITNSCNVIDLDAAIEALKNAVRYIEHDAETYKEIRSIAAEICFHLGLAYHAKAFEVLRSSNTSDYQRHIEEAKKAYGNSLRYSREMLEANYNLARCKALTNDENGAIDDLITIMLKDHGYCIKAFVESDFDNALKDKLSNKIKEAVYSKAKTCFDQIKTIRANFKHPYSAELTRLIETYLPNIFDETTLPFDMLKATFYFPEIIAVLEKERKENEEKKKEKEKLNRIAKFQASISAGSLTTVGLKVDGTVVAVGSYVSGFRHWRDIVALSAGCYSTVGLKADNTVEDKNWRDVVSVAHGWQHTVVLKADGTVIVDDDKNEHGQCNTQGWRDIVAVAAGAGNTVGLKADGTVVAVGANSAGQCNTQNWRDIIAVSASNHTVGLKADGTVVAVGSNEEYNHEIEKYVRTGKCDTQSWRDIIAISAGSSHTVGLKADGTVVAVGSNTKYNGKTFKHEYSGQCDTQSWRDIVAVAAGWWHTVGLKADGTVVAVGDNSDGQCNTQGWRDIGPASEEQRLKLKQKEDSERRQQWEQRQEEARRKLEEQKRIKQSTDWQSQGLCRYCGGQLSGLFQKKCTSCGKPKQ